MNTLALPPRFNSYKLTEAIEERGYLPAVWRSEPNETGVEELLLQKLGPHGWGRMHHFRNFYGPGWGNGQGKPVSPRAFESMVRFLKAVQFPTPSFPSIFLTDRGGLELCWEDAIGKKVQVEFCAEGAEFYVESTGDEGVLPLTSLDALLRVISQANAS